MMPYKSDREFRLWIYTTSHGVLLMRSNKRVDESGNNSTDDYTIDIEFWGVTYIQLPHRLSGLYIELIDNWPLELIQADQKELKRLKVFEITSEGRKNYIVCFGCSVGKSRMDYYQNRLDDLKLKYDEILFSA